MTDRHCVRCRHWAHPEHPHTGAGQGICERITLKVDSEWAYSEGQKDLFAITDADFGCVLFDPTEP